MVSLLDNGSCFRKVAPNTRSSEKSRIAFRDDVSGCMANAPPAEQKGPLLYSSPPDGDLAGRCLSLPLDALKAGYRLPSVRESHVPSLWRPRYLRMRCSDTAVRRVGRAPGRSYGTCQYRRDTRCTACMSCQSLHVVLGLLQQPRSCGPPGLHVRRDRLCLGLLRGAHVAQRGY
jgi:hypothetical protein